MLRGEGGTQRRIPAFLARWAARTRRGGRLSTEGVGSCCMGGTALRAGGRWGRAGARGRLGAYKLVAQRDIFREGGGGGHCALFFYSKVFRQSAVARRSRPEPLDERLQVTAPHEWVVLCALGLSLSGFLGWAVLGSVERGLVVKTVLVQPGERHAVVSPVSGVVVEVRAGSGAVVESGEAVARVRQPESAREARVTRRIVEAVEAGVGGGEGVGALRGALLEAARAELATLEREEGEWVVAPKGGRLEARGLETGRAVRAGETVARVRGGGGVGGGAGRWEALALVTPQQAGDLRAGMGAEVKVSLPGVALPSRLPARVVEVSPRSGGVPVWVAELGLSSSAPAHLVRLGVEGAGELALAEGTGGVARVVLGRQSPAALLLGSGGL